MMVSCTWPACPSGAPRTALRHTVLDTRANPIHSRKQTMLRFAVYDDGKPAKAVDLAAAYLVGSDGVPVRADIEFKKGEILCRKRTTGPAALAILWEVPGGARVMLETTRLPERDKPYILQVELLRGRLMRIAQKREDWGLHDFEGTDEIARQIDRARDLLIEGLQADTLAKAAAAAQNGLAVGLTASEYLTAFHAEIFLSRRKQVGGFPRRVFGAAVDIDTDNPTYRKNVAAAYDYITLPFCWKKIEPREKDFNWAAYDQWIEWAIAQHLPVRGSGVVSFTPESIPDWLYIWEHDFDTVRDLTCEHIQRVIERYGKYIQTWEIITGLHTNSCFGFNFEQLMELTRMSTAVAKKLAPRSVVTVNITMPWGEYYATNQRSIPPMLYAEMVMQSGVNFDALGLECCFGVGVPGRYVRDLFQVSAILDRFACLGKPVHLTAVQAPSDTVPDLGDAWGGKYSVQAGGVWHKDWSEETQRAWLRRVYHIALSKPFIEAICWRDAGDTQSNHIPHGGLLRRDATPKPAHKELVAIRQELLSDPHKTSAAKV